MLDRVKAFFRLEGVNGGVPWRMFWVGLAARLLYITVAGTFHVRPTRDHFEYGWEAGRIARALATGYGYSDPFVGHTGPTTWLPPLFPLLLAGVFKVLGVYTAASAWVILAIDSVFSAGTALAVYEIGERCFDRRPGADLRARQVALWSGWLWALYPAALQFAVHWIWDMSIATFLLAWTMVLALRVRGVGNGSSTVEERDRRATSRWAVFGLMWGLIALSNASLLLFLPACGLWMLRGAVGNRSKLAKATARAAMAACLLVVCLAPWTWRNWQTFHAFIPTRGNLGAELYASTRESNNGFPWGSTVPPSVAEPEYRAYKSMGELAYMRERGGEAKIWLRTHPRRFAQWTLKRVWFYWAGIPFPFGRIPAAEIVREMNFGFGSLAGLLGLALAVRRRVEGAWLFAAAFSLIPMIYYVVTVQARFRHPLEPLITVLGVYLFQSAERGRAWSRGGKAAIQRARQAEIAGGVR